MIGTRHATALAAAVALAAACTAENTTPDESAGGPGDAPAVESWDAVVDVVVEALELEPGERVFAAASPTLFPDLVASFATAVEQAGGVYLGAVGPEAPIGSTGDASFLAASTGLSRAGYRDLLADVPVGIMLPGAQTSDPAYAAFVDLLRESSDERRAIHFHWGGMYDVVDRSTPVSAEASPVPTVDARADSVYRAAITMIDHAAVAASQRAFEAAARGGEIRVTTPAGTDLRFRIEDRPVNRQDGVAGAARARSARILIDREIEYPTGAFRVAPVETTVTGVMAFPTSIWSGQTVENLRLTIEAGRVVAIEATGGEESARTELDAAGEAAAFRELGVGFNPMLQVPDDDPWLPYFGYGAGVVRLSLGDNSELGGLVGGGYVRWIFVLDATLTIDGEVWVEDGRLIRSQ